VAIARINHFEAKDGCITEVRELLTSVIDTIRGAPGCRSCRLLEAIDDDRQFVITEVWESVEAHQAAAGAIPPVQMERAVALLAGPPKGVYYRISGESVG